MIKAIHSRKNPAKNRKRTELAKQKRRLDHQSRENTRNRNHLYIENADHRYQALTTLSKSINGPGGRQHSKGAIVEASTYIHIEKATLWIPTPNMASLYLNASNDAYLQSKELWDELSIDYQQAPNLYLSNVARDVPRIFDSIEGRAIAVILAYSALEAFANQVIPEDYRYATKQKGDPVTLTKLEIEKNVSLTEKLKTMLPILLNVTSPADQNYWRIFLDLKKLRDELIHIKKIPQLPDQIEDPSTSWRGILDKDLINYAVALKPLFMHFFPTGSQSFRWMEKAPYWK